MNKSQLIITLSIILLGLSPVNAGKNNKTNNKFTVKKPIQPDMKPVQTAALAYVEPTGWVDCEDLVDDGHIVLNAAVAEKIIPTELIPESAEALEKATCSWTTANGYSFYKFEHKKGDSVCTVYAVASLYTFRLRQVGDLKYSKEHTTTANKKMGECKSVVEDKSIQTDEIVEEEAAAPIMVEETVGQKEFHDEVHPNKIPEVNTVAPKSKFFYEHQAKVEQKSAEVESLSEIELPKFVRQNAIIPKYKTPSYEPTAEDFSQLYNEQEEHDALHTHLMGGWQECSEKNLRHVPRFFNVLSARGLIYGIHIYTENVIHCEQQVVNGLNFNVKVGFNDSVCQVALHVSLNNEVSSLNTATQFEDPPLCTQVFKPFF